LKVVKDMTVETFEQVLAAAQAAGGLNPAWKKFLKTKFFVPVDRPSAADPGRFSLHVAPARAGRGPAIQIAEDPQRLDPGHGNGRALMYGSEVVRKLQVEAEILVALQSSAFTIALDKVDWLKRGVEAARARAAAERAALTQSAGHSETMSSTFAGTGGPATVAAPVTLHKSAPVAAPAPARRNNGVLDVAALKPRSVANPAIGLSFFVPGAWVEKRNTRSTFYTDLASGTKLEVSGAHRPGMTLGQFMTQRLGQVGHDMPYLRQADVPYQIDGDDWRGKIRGMATEFTGTFPGEDFESRYLLACIWTEGTVVWFGIRVAADEFENQHAIYKWLLSKVELAGGAESMYGATSAAGDGYDGDTWTPPAFGVSLEGRIGRLRGMAYTLLVTAPFLVVMGALAFMFRSNMLVLGVAMLVACTLLMWFGLRLMVLRLHDLNRSGKWILLLILMMGAAGAAQSPVLLVAASGVFWLLQFVIFYLAPGSAGGNDYGPPPDPNTLAVKIGAGLFIALQVLAIYGQVQLARLGPAAFDPRARLGANAGGAAAPVAPSAAPTAFSPSDKSFTVTLPGTPRIVPLPDGARERMGEVLFNQYELKEGGREYIIQSMNFRSAAPDANEIMDRLQAAVVGRDGRLANAGPIGMNGYTGREVRVEVPREGGPGGLRVSRFVVHGARVASVTVVGPADAATEAAASAVMDSFELRSRDGGI